MCCSQALAPFSKEARVGDTLETRLQLSQCIQSIMARVQKKRLCFSQISASKGRSTIANSKVLVGQVENKGCFAAY